MVSNSWSSYPKVWNLGHPEVAGILDQPVVVEEKIDGSQFSFAQFGRELLVRSKNKEMDPDAPEQMFGLAVDTARGLFDRGQLVDGWTYRAEYLRKPKHNTLAYSRTPVGNLILFDVTTGPETYLAYHEKAEEADRLGLEVVPLLVPVGTVVSAEFLAILLSQAYPRLGGPGIEGVVVKAYGRFGRDGKTLMGKHVSERFKERHRADWSSRNPGATGIVERLTETLRTPARWEKALQAVRDRGELEGSPRDIPRLIAQVRANVLAEDAELIREKLYEWAAPKVVRGLAHGLAEWYKAQLLAGQK